MKVLKRLWLFLSNAEVRGVLLQVMDIQMDWLQGEIEAEQAVERIVNVLVHELLNNSDEIPTVEITH